MTLVLRHSCWTHIIWFIWSTYSTCDPLVETLLLINFGACSAACTLDYSLPVLIKTAVGERSLEHVRP